MRRLFELSDRGLRRSPRLRRHPQGQERPAAGGRAPVALPDGPGKDEVTATCAACHGLNMITGAAGYTQSGWRDLVATMVTLPASARPPSASTSRRTSRRSPGARRSSSPAT